MTRNVQHRSVHARVIALLLIVGALCAFTSPTIRAINLGTRSVKVGTSLPGATTSHTILFTTIAASTIGSVQLEYCANDPFVGKPCVVPTGLDVSSAAITSQTGITGFSIHPNTTSNKLVITRIPSAEAPTATTLTFSTITNPSTPNQTIYIRISTHASTDGSGTFDNDGGVAFRILNGVGTQAYVPPFLIFCVGLTVAPDCSSSMGAYVGLGELSTTSPNTGRSQFAGATNDVSGYNVSITGITMTSGNDEIPALALPTNSVPGTSQFGINLRANTNPVIGSNQIGAGSLSPTAPYNNINQFAFVPGATIATSPISTEFNTMTVSYLANVATSQPPGTYTTTLTYVAVAAF